MTSRRKSPGRKGGGSGRRAAKSAPPKASPPKASPPDVTPPELAPPSVAVPGIEPDDAALWRRVANSTAPLPGRRTAPAAPAIKGEPKPEDIGPAKSASRPAMTPPAARRPPVPSLPPLAPGAAPGVDQRTAMRLRRGQLPIDARVDLHGLTLEEGFRAFSLFIADASESGARCVLAITGKGSRSRGPAGEVASGVLREALPGWLNRPSLRPLVLAFCPARPKDGGAGAFYILLKRRR